MTEFKQLPHNVEAEQSVLGALLRDNDAIDRIGDLRAEHFFVGDHGTIFEVIVGQLSAGRAVDPISMIALLSGRVQDARAYMGQLTQTMPSSANIARHASIVRDHAIKRAMVALGRDLAEASMTLHGEAATIIDETTSKLEHLAESKTKQEPIRASQDMARHIGEIQARLEGGVKAISTGYAALDKRLNGGIRRGELIVLAGRPAMGKTALAMNIATAVARDHSALVLSMEMPLSQLHDRNIASIGHIQLNRLLAPSELDDDDWNRLTHASVRINDLDLYLDDQGALRLLDVRLKAKAVKRKNGLDLLVIDYLQLMDGDGDNRNAQIEQITRGLKALAKELDIGIILLSQLNRTLENRPNKRPHPSDLRDSGAIEQDADAILFVYRDEVYNADSPDKGICEVIFGKVRQGAPGTEALLYIGEQVRFENLTHWTPRAAEERRKVGRRYEDQM